MLKAALFDLDGTLLDTESQYSLLWGRIGQTYRPEIPGFAQVIKGTTLQQILDRYFPDEAVRQKVVASLDAWEREMTYAFYPGVREFLGDLRRHDVRCAVVTSSNHLKMANVERQIPDFTSLFDKVLTAEDFSASKPDPDCYLKGAAALGCAIEECVVFEDAFTGLDAGMASGIFTIGLPTTNSREAVASHCHYVLDSFENISWQQLVQIIKNYTI